MKTIKSIRNYYVQSLALGLGMFVQTSAVNATPYASGVTNNGTIVSFILNESADNVKVLFDAGTVTNDLGALPKGTYTANLIGATNFQIVVYKASAAGYTTGPGNGGTATALKTSTDSDPLINFFVPKGIDVNRNPNSPYFGRIYVANDTAGTTTVNASRATTAGIYMLNADQTDAVGQGNTARTGGATFGSTTDNGPYHIRVGEDDNLYVCDWSDPRGNLYRFDPDCTVAIFALKTLTTNGFGTNVNAIVPIGTNNNHGSLAACWVTGSTNTGDLKIYTIDEDLQVNKNIGAATNQMNSLWRYDVDGNALPFTNLSSGTTKMWTASSAEGVNSSSQTMDMFRAPDGKFFITTLRSAGNECGLIVRDSTSSTTLFHSKNMSVTLGNTTDYLKNSSSVAVSPDGNWVAVQTGNTGTASDNKTWIMPLTNGIPDLSKRNVLSTFTTLSSRQLTFDAAGNLYTSNNGFEALKIFSPGGTTITTYSNDLTGTNGSFTVVTIDPGISTQPVSSTTNAGVNVQLTVVATGTSPFTYQWQKNGTNVANATTTRLTLNNVQQTNAGTYLVLVSNALGDFIVSSNAVIAVTDTLPIITVQPTNATVACGSNVVLRVGTTGTDPRSYQWSFNGANISGATASSLTRNNAQAANDGSYQVIITNALGSATSVVAVLTVTNTLPIILIQPAGRTNGAGTNVTLSVTTLGTDPRVWQWRFNGSNISGATASSYVQNNIQTNASGDYTVVITNIFGSVTSAVATVLITNRAPVINTQPANKTVNAGSNVVFSVTSAGTTPLSYQWSFNAVEIPGATANSYTVTNAQQPNAGTYSVVITNDLGVTPSANATLTVIDIAPVITTQPQSQSVTNGTAVSFSVVATGTTPFVYRWKKNGANITDATNSNFSLPSAQTGDAGTYTVAITNSIGGTISSNAVLTVIVPNTLVIQPLQGAGTTSVIIRWASVSGATYRVQFTTNLVTTNWGNIPPDTFATGTTSSLTNNTGGDRIRYYRVMQLP